MSQQHRDEIMKALQLKLELLQQELKSMGDIIIDQTKELTIKDVVHKIEGLEHTIQQNTSYQKRVQQQVSDMYEDDVLMIFMLVLMILFLVFVGFATTKKQLQSRFRQINICKAAKPCERATASI